MGAQYLYAANPRIDLGLSVDHWKTGTKSFTAAPLAGEMKMSSTMLMVVAKMHRLERETFSPYALVGVGVHITQFDLDLLPAPGYIWSTGNPTGKRSVVSDKKSGVALSFGLGMDAEINKLVFASFEGRFDIVSKQTYDSTAYGQSIGISGAEAGAVNGVLMIRIGRRFGGRSAKEVTIVPVIDAPQGQPAKSEGPI